MAAFTFAAISGGMAVILWAVLACSAPLAITSASSFPSMTVLQPGIKSPHLSTFAMVALPPILLRRDWSVTSAPTGHKAHGAAERSLGIVRGTVNLNGFFMSSPSMWSRRQMLAERGSDFPPAVDSAQLDFPAGHETEEQNQRRVFAWQRTSRL